MEVDHTTITYSPVGDLELGEQIGRGKYSDVYIGYDPKDGSKIVLKILQPVRPGKLKREIKILENLKGSEYTINLRDKTESSSST